MSTSTDSNFRRRHVALGREHEHYRNEQAGMGLGLPPNPRVSSAADGSGAVGSHSGQRPNKARDLEEARRRAMAILERENPDFASLMRDPGTVHPVRVPADGDCFFSSVAIALTTASADVAEAITRRASAVAGAEFYPANATPGRLRELVASRILDASDDTSDRTLRTWVELRVHAETMLRESDASTTPASREERERAEFQLDNDLIHVQAVDAEDPVSSLSRRRVADQIRRRSFWGEQFSIDTLANYLGIRFMVFDRRDEAVSLGISTDPEGVPREGPVTCVVPLHHEASHYEGMFHSHTNRMLFRPDEVPAPLIRTMRKQKHMSFRGIDEAFLNTVTRAQERYEHVLGEEYDKLLRERDAAANDFLASQRVTLAGPEDEESKQSSASFTVRQLGASVSR